MEPFNVSPLTPTSFLERSAIVFANRIAVVDGERRFTYHDFHDRSARLAGALTLAGIERGDRVAALCANSHVMLELHNGVPLAGAVLVPLNTRLSADELEYILVHSGAKVLINTHEFSDMAADVAARTGIRTIAAGGDENEYEFLLSESPPGTSGGCDERELLAINYTSGTTGRPKGVMYHHRGAYLQSLAMAFHTRLTVGSNYLWTLPMFHCNGWCFTWAVTAAGATHICLRSLDTAEIWRLLAAEGVTHFSAAPTVLNIIATSPSADPQVCKDTRVQVQTGGAPPSPPLLSRMSALGMDVTHLYGLTETYGPVAINEWHPDWDELTPDEQARTRARQGVGNVVTAGLRVVHADGRDVPSDGETLGEIVCRGNNLMLGYYRDDSATSSAMIAGWFATGDLAVVHPDGYVEIRDRRKDIIISGGENISSVEIERLLDAHPGVLECAVVAQADDTWGEVPVAFVTPRAGVSLAEEDLTAHVRAHLARFKTPKRFFFGELPKTSTGKIQKNVLRARLEGSSGGTA